MTTATLPSGTGMISSYAGGLSNEFDFAGQQTDGTGLQYLRAKYYDPAAGTFLSRDPLQSPGWAGPQSAHDGSLNLLRPSTKAAFP
ncbi:RHS repeat-associated core domain-containing protein [Candidatus Amarobacter glycogenicus]|uniref:RHS repeat-associated core domain-containing protein n=1 Tax=Candidatus Amarobacter glycogenicus TaxID=3140699 RepID=UPI003135E77F|nr:hypothetical protein [Dehalococcoidia bacterium]